MTEFLIRRFAAGDDMEQMRQRCGKLGGVVGILVNLLLSGGKLAAGLLAGSVAITADAVNNLSDAGSSVISLVSFRLAARPADKEHPFGHARIEYVASMIVAGLILLLGVELLRSSVERIITPEETAFSWLTVGVLVFSILMKLWLYHFNITMGRRIGSQLMEATAADSLSDVLATGGVLLSTILSPLLGVPLDGWMGLVVAAFILRSGIGIIREALDKILGEAPTGELVREIEDYVRSYDGVVDCHDLVVHNYGPGRCFASVHAEVPASSDIMASHDVIDNIERDIFRDKNIHLVIHMDPVVVDDADVDRRREQVRQVLAGIGGELSFHDFRMVSGPTHTNMIFDVVAPFGFPLSDEQLCQRIQEGARALDPTLYTVVTVDRQG